MDIINQDQLDLGNALTRLAEARKKPIVQYTKCHFPEPFKESKLSLQEITCKIKLQHANDAKMVEEQHFIVQPFIEKSSTDRETMYLETMKRTGKQKDI